MKRSRRSMLTSLGVMATLPWLAWTKHAFAAAPMRLGVIGAFAQGGPGWRAHLPAPELRRELAALGDAQGTRRERYAKCP